MPLRKSGTLIRALQVAAAATAFAVAAPAAASAACVEQPATQAFSKYGDSSWYSTAPGGDFEASSAKWSTFLGASTVFGNDLQRITPGIKALWMPYLSFAKSPEFCVDETHPTFRYMRMATWGATMKVLILYRDTAGKLTQAQVESVTETTQDAGWKPSVVSPLATKIPLVTGGQAASVQLYFLVTSGYFWIDSVMVDPYRRG